MSPVTEKCELAFWHGMSTLSIDLYQVTTVWYCISSTTKKPDKIFQNQDQLKD